MAELGSPVNNPKAEAAPHQQVGLSQETLKTVPSQRKAWKMGKRLETPLNSASFQGGGIERKRTKKMKKPRVQFLVEIWDRLGLVSAWYQ